MERDYSAFCHAGTSFKAEYAALPSGVELLTVIFTPSTPAGKPPVLFIPGLVSIIENFRDTLIELTRDHTVIFIETREKSSAVISNEHRFTVDEIASDIVQYAGQRFSAAAPYVMAGYSLGATVVAEAFCRLKTKPVSVIMVEPNGSFPFNRWLLILARMARYIYKPVKPFLKWYLRTFIIDLEQDEEMYLINCRNLDTAEPVRLGRAVRDLSSYHTGSCPGKITVPALVVVASNDRFHNHDEGTELARQVPGAVYIDLLDNRRTHSTEMGRIMRDFISSPAQIPAQAGQLLPDIS
jgi:pimeloyl-ACP methyl ester carboxylesterase